jgi:hypothetical protein
MAKVPNGAEVARPFLPAKDFALSQRFYEVLGFEKGHHDKDVAIFAIGSGGFLLQNYYQKEWAENCMMQLVVDDLDAWWAHIESLDLPAQFGVPAPRAPAPQPWGLRVAYLIDPSGVPWHIAQR